jgi:hypothetical protein
LKGEKIIEDIRIILAGIWIALMLTYLLGDVMRIFAGDFTAGQIGNMQISQGMLLFMAIIMLFPIVMLLLSLTLTYPLIRWLSIVIAIFLFIFNIIGLPGYTGLYDKFLIVVGLVFNVMTVWYAWTWT